MKTFPVKKIISLSLALLLCAAAFAIPGRSYAAEYLHAAYSHETADPAWLSDLVIKESVYGVSDLGRWLDLVAVPTYPYDETPESFSKKASYFADLYDLDQASLKAMYIYILSQLNVFSMAQMDDVSDAEVKAYLTEKGLKFIDDDGETMILARALYYADVRGVAGNYVTYGPGQTVAEAIIAFVAGVLGVKVGSLSVWLPEGGTVNDLRTFVVAAAKDALFNEGYDVEPDTSEEELCAIIAAMVTREAGYAVDGNSTLEELKVKYTAAMLSVVYGIRVDPTALGTALESGNLDFYLIKAIGKSFGLTVRDSMSYAEAFTFVAENSDYFSFDVGDFWSDIYNYKAYPAVRRNSLWVYPTSSVRVKDGSASVSISVNGETVANEAYTEVPIDIDADVQALTIKVVYTDALKNSEKTYVVLVDQTDCPYPDEVESTEPVSDDVSTNVIGGILQAAGLSDSTTAAVLSGLSAFIPGVFDSSPLTIGSAGITIPASGSQPDSLMSAMSALDVIGETVDSSLSGIGAFDAFSGSMSQRQRLAEMLSVSFD